jgi:type IX secretion system PorP/SprF family membrane protein
MKGRKNLLLFYVILSGIMLPVCSSAQQTAQYTNFVHNYFTYNPALAGSPDCMTFKLGFRSQWVNLNGSPQTGFGTLQTRLKSKKRRTDMNYHGIGAMVEGDNIGYFSRTTMQLAYSYHFKLKKNVTASIGLFGGLQQFRMDASQVLVANYNDPALNSSASAFILPYISPGLFLSHDNWFAGLAIRQFVRNKWDAVVGTSSRNLHHYSIMGGKRIKLKKDINLVPAIMVKWVRMSPPSIDLNIMAEIGHTVDLGLSWRNQDALAILAKIKFARFFTLAYAFDFTSSKMRLGSSNTHEVIIGITTCPHDRKNTFTCPVFD